MRAGFQLVKVPQSKSEKATQQLSKLLSRKGLLDLLDCLNNHGAISWEPESVVRYRSCEFTHYATILYRPFDRPGTWELGIGIRESGEISLFVD